MNKVLPVILPAEKKGFTPTNKGEKKAFPGPLPRKYRLKEKQNAC